MKEIIGKPSFSFRSIKLVLLCCSAFIFSSITTADEFLDVDLDPASILDDSSSQNDIISIPPVSLYVYDIQQFKPNFIDINNTQPVVPPAKNFIAEVKNEKIKNLNRITDETAEDITSSFIIPAANNVSHDSPVNNVKFEDTYPAKDDLKKIIEQIRSINTGQERNTNTESRAKAKEPNTSISSKTVPVNIIEVNSQDEPAVSLLNDQVIQQIDDLIKEPNRIPNPLELAEILFKSGKTSQAAICYKQSLLMTPADDANFAGERAWILFQIGNCLKFDDPNTARESFSELLSRHPDSPWAQAAKTSRDLTEWLQQDEPKKLINEFKK
jgi:hypothetical protein